MKTRAELAAAILEREYVTIDGPVDVECPWCHASGDMRLTNQNRYEVVGLVHLPTCLWLELKGEG
jgi:hypothetical protein